MSGFKFYIKDYTSDPIARLYDLKETIGSGTFAEVKRGIDRATGKDWAIKMIAKAKLDKEDEEALAVEVEILEKVNHANIVQLRQVIDTRRHFYMVMELLTGGELFDRIVDKVKYTEQEAVGVVRQVAQGLDYCHKLGIVHRDLKPENLIYASKDEDAAIKIADFGLGKIVDDDRIAMATACGTPGYVAAEILQGQKYTDKVDCWSIGVITYILLCGFPPFYDENMHNLFRLIKAGRFGYPSPYWDGVTEEAKDFINKLLVTDPKKRMSAADCLSHPWLKAKEAPEASGSGAAAGGVALSGAQEMIKKMQIRKKFRSKVHSVVALNRFKRLSGLAGLSLAARLEKAADTEEGPGLTAAAGSAASGGAGGGSAASGGAGTGAGAGAGSSKAAGAGPGPGAGK